MIAIIKNKKYNRSNTMLPKTFVSSYHDQSSVSQLQYRTIGVTDMTVSTLSFGASSLGGVFRETDDSESGRKSSLSHYHYTDFSVAF